MTEQAESGLRNSVLVLMAHPVQRRSRVIARMAKVAEWVPGVTLVDLYAEYPDFDIDIAREQDRLRSHDAVIFLHPLYWYSTPSILKEWQDLVLEYGFAYGQGGTALEGKLFFSACSTAAPESAYGPEGYNRFTLRDLMAPLQQTARLCGMTWLPPFVLHGARSAGEEGRLQAHVDAWETLLAAIVAGRLDVAVATGADRLIPPTHPLGAEG
ncbi:flavodoxin family protein [Halovulum dunhuangense]|uniref:Flavodoxin family protein n=1 Tax=Halovulum dunhuangense TaxID=1505036 RepID=A0A849L4Z5_9RHOB|nr:NAD(P)H-dependent oxidoreductase [Halovulum dunhuangense]NNU81429.1 flavodoxin family protein [Halovulum dunhuangense]